MDPRRKKKESSIPYGYSKIELMQECSPKHLRMGTSRLKEEDKETRQRGQAEKSENGKKSGYKIKKSQGLAVVGVYRPMGWLPNEAVDELPK